MNSFIYKRIFILLILFASVVVSAVLTTQAMAIGLAETKTLNRDLEPVVIKGFQASTFSGAPVDDLFVYTFNGSFLNGQIPVQIDEVSAGNYVTAEDGILDSDDEIVIMVKDLGDEKPATTLLTTTLTISDTWYEIEVADSLSPTKKGWAYLVRSSSLSPSFTGDYANYTASPPTITASQYEMRVETAYAALNYLALNGGANILDQTKLRAVLEVFGVPTTITEEDLQNPTVTLIKDGPVRVLLQQSSSSAGLQASMSTIYKAYAALMQGAADVSFTTNPLVNVVSLRTSADLDSAVNATFYNANTPAGVTIDGNPVETVAETPLSNWFQISHSTGRFIQVTNPSPVGGTQKNFYRDNSNPEIPDTGQAGSYGDSGYFIEGSINENFTLQSSIFVLPAVGGNVGSTYESYFNNPLLVSTGLQGAPSSGTVFLPIIIKNN